MQTSKQNNKRNVCEKDIKGRSNKKLKKHIESDFDNTKPKFKQFKLPKEHTIQPVTQRFKLKDSTRQEIQLKIPKFGFNGLGEVVFRRTYSRNNETWNDVVIRVIEGVFSIRKEHFFRNSLGWEDEDWQTFAREMATSMFDMEWLPPGRGLWAMGTDFVYERGSMALNNCSSVDTKDDLVLAGDFLFDSLMNGVGVGFSTYWRGDVYTPNKKNTKKYVIDDSRFGWVNSFIILMCSYIESPKYGKNSYFPLFDYSQIRKSGEPIRGFGGTASGSEPLEKLHKRMENFLDSFCRGYMIIEKIIKWNDGKFSIPFTPPKTRKIHGKLLVEEKGRTGEYIENYKKPYKSHTRLIADIMNSIGACVVAGNVRRSAEISLGDVEDDEFINLKNYDKNPERADIGWMSNNSVVLKPYHDYQDFSYIPDMAKRIKDNGEPGLINLLNIQKYERYGKEKPDKATLVNPCGEILLESFEICNLSETFPPRCKNKDRLFEALKFATFYSSTVSLLPTHRSETNSVIARNRRIGVSISGISQWASGNVPAEWGNMNYTKMTTFLREGYKIVENENKKLAEEAGIPASIRVTTVKPSGSISLLAGCTPGCHYPVSKLAIRRMRIGMDSPLVPALKDAGIPYENDKYSDNTLVFEFVIDHGDVRPCRDVSPWEQFGLVSMLQRCWSSNSVSATIYFDKKKHGDDIEKLLAMYIPVLKSVSMLPIDDHNYEQAPYEEIDEKTYRERLSNYTTPNFNKVIGNVPKGEKFCTNDMCTL
jgi:ribonucleoside-triphosphate reductase